MLRVLFSTYWMAGLAPHAANFFKFLLILVLYTICMTLFVTFPHRPSFAPSVTDSCPPAFSTGQNFLVGSAISDGGLALLLSSLAGLYQMTFAGFFVHLNSIPEVLRWLQWMCPLKYALEALTVNEVNSGLQIKDTLSGVPVSVSAALIMQIVRTGFFYLFFYFLPLPLPPYLLHS
jgi:ABC-2 type transporter